VKRNNVRFGYTRGSFLVAALFVLGWGEIAVAESLSYVGGNPDFDEGAPYLPSTGTSGASAKRLRYFCIATHQMSKKSLRGRVDGPCWSHMVSIEPGERYRWSCEQPPANVQRFIVEDGFNNGNGWVVNEQADDTCNDPSSFFYSNNRWNVLN
jgi:hypothetical protein